MKGTIKLVAEVKDPFLATLFAARDIESIIKRQEEAGTGRVIVGKATAAIHGRKCVQCDELADKQGNHGWLCKEHAMVVSHGLTSDLMWQGYGITPAQAADPNIEYEEYLITMYNDALGG